MKENGASVVESNISAGRDCTNEFGDWEETTAVKEERKNRHNNANKSERCCARCVRRMFMLLVVAAMECITDMGDMDMGQEAKAGAGGCNGRWVARKGM
mmetsp:Transcript_13217/g.28674  ORF Transcript_13217/g.28674 Transcript_13217/m.28674 type:complete len:99 (+) Transcript_13217:947-1243(+)